MSEERVPHMQTLASGPGMVYAEIGHFRRSSFVPQVDDKHFANALGKVKASASTVVEQQELHVLRGNRLVIVRPDGSKTSIERSTNSLTYEAINREHSLRLVREYEEVVNASERREEDVSETRLIEMTICTFRQWMYVFYTVRAGTSDRDAKKNPPYYMIRVYPPQEKNCPLVPGVLEMLFERGKQMLGTHVNNKPQEVVLREPFYRKC